jgi:hypothetical protein
MLDGKRYYAAFPDEYRVTQPPMLVSRALIDALNALEMQLWQKIELFGGTTTPNSRPGTAEKA